MVMVALHIKKRIMEMEIGNGDWDTAMTGQPMLSFGGIRNMLEL